MLSVLATLFVAGFLLAPLTVANAHQHHGSMCVDAPQTVNLLQKDGAPVSPEKIDHGDSCCVVCSGNVTFIDPLARQQILLPVQISLRVESQVRRDSHFVEFFTESLGARGPPAQLI